MKDSRRALAVSCWFKLPYSTVLAMPLAYAERLYEAIPSDHRPSDDPPYASFLLNGMPVTFDDLRIWLRGALGLGVSF